MDAASRSRSDATLPTPDPALDHFARLGMPRRFALDGAELDLAYTQRAAEVHPDRFVGSDALTRQRAEAHTARLNEAYRVLKHPLRRAEYLVKLGGIDLDSSEASGGAPHPEPEFLAEMIERRDEIESDGVDLEAAAERARSDADREMRAALSALERVPAEFSRAAMHLVKLRYFNRLAEELERRIETLM